MHGVLVVDKPQGITSHDVVARARRILDTREVGHTGTLDPMATGVLPLVVGEGTKLAPFLQADDKEYEGAFELGVVTDTLDIEGTVLARHPVAVTEDRLREAVRGLTGDLLQVPPMYSAIKQGGQALHKLARRGIEVEREARPVRVDRFELTGDRTFVVACSKGTYVRALVRDLGERLGCGATLTALRRTRAGRFTLADATPLDGLASARLVPPHDAVGHLPAVTLTAAELVEVGYGRPAAPRAPSGSSLPTVSWPRWRKKTPAGSRISACSTPGAKRVDRQVGLGHSSPPTNAEQCR